MKRESKRDRQAWTEYVEGTESKANKYNVAPKEDRGHYASLHEARTAQKLWALADRGVIQNLREQVKFELIPGDGKIRPITYVADFVWVEDGEEVVADAKGMKTPVYRLKKKMLKLLKGIEIREL